MDKLILREMHFSARHGVLPAEAENDQPFSATVELELSTARAGASDRIEDAIDYRKVQGVVRDVIGGSRKHLIETLAEQIAGRLLAAFPEVHAVVVEVVKPRPPVDFQFAGVSVKIRREQGGAAR
ncbi:dihydroneopterin aldolase [Opitutus sp. ER46]|uniref:dihydroneopterin aldolase n=1 Tax=Opitutus sp. ER46 TaxID=2161864 RepID=UPI000D3247B0|nr:dihydroneopterin aldolase [Opitutus sp. ER46]PTX92686.1 dihydroneopterin aldolase [Opitutus sp. ER46]